MKDKNKKTRPTVIIIACALVFLPILVILIIRMEGQAPELSLEMPSNYVGIKTELNTTLADSKSGLKRFWVSMIQNGKEVTLVDKRFPASGFLKKGTVLTTSERIEIEPKKYGLADGDALLRLMVVDYAWHSWGKGNRTYAERNISIDTRAPSIKVLTRSHNISPGGSNAIAYELSEPCESSGVRIGDHFYPGYPFPEEQNTTIVAFFALNYRQTAGTQMDLIAQDRAGNHIKTSFHHYIKKKRFKKDTIRVSDSFILGKLPDFNDDLADKQLTLPLEQFLYINRELRKQNKAVLSRLMQQSDPVMHWKGTFLRLPKSATRSGFGDHRTYQYGGKRIDQQTHLGIDLASLSNSPIPAANAGKVVYAKHLGIYGRMIVIDHGLGLFSMYAHLSSFNVQVGAHVEKGDIIGHTGTSGLAGGDHLHFSVLINGTFVNPLEWWDASWIANNILNKIERLGESK